MRALVLDHPGSFDRLHMAEIPAPEPGPGEIRVRVLACGLNPVDYKLLGGGHPAWTYPFVLGLDVAGTIDALGEGVTGWQTGDRVFYHGNLARPGGFAEYTVTLAHVAARIPEGLPAVDAAALPCAGITAYLAVLRRLRVAAGQIALIHGGSGGVGGFGVQLAKYAGATVITTCSPRHEDYVKALGADEALDYHEDLTPRIMAITQGLGVDAAVDVVGRESATQALGLLAFGGGLACVESLPDLSRWHMFDRAISVHEIALGPAYVSGDRRAEENLAYMASELAVLVVAGHIRSLVAEVVPLDAVPDALRRLKEGRVRGKLVAEIA
jgi:NADPH:quinone reductase-like Zn-dependent oxidoreductase